MRLPEQAMKFHVSLMTVVCGLAAFPALASAQDQPWLKDRRYTEGIGYKVGDFELHPGLAAEFGYDSNFLHLPSSPGGALRLRVTPSFSFSTLGGQRRDATPGSAPPDVEFRAGISATYNEFFPVNGPQNAKDSLGKQRNLGGNLDLDLRIKPGRPWSGELTAGVQRLITPTESGITGSSFNRDTPHAGAEIAYTPGSGLLDWRLGYNFASTLFESSSFSGLTNLSNEISTRGRWRFLPRTALMYDARFGFVSYPNAPNAGGTVKLASHPMRAMIGLNGLVTSSFSVLALVGWGASFYTPAPQEDFNSVIGRLELRWYITPNPSSDPAAATLTLSSIALGFNRDFYDSYLGTYYERDRGYANLSYFFGGSFLVVVDGGVAPIIYPHIPVAINPGGDVPAFTDIRADASVFGEYRFKDSFGINTTIRYGQNINKSPVPIAGGGAEDLSWAQFEAYLGARWFM